MEALSQTYDLLIHLRSLCSAAHGKSSLTAEDERQLLKCIEQVTDVEQRRVYSTHYSHPFICIYLYIKY